MKLFYKGTEIFYQAEGNGPTVLLLHGFLEDLSMWNPLVDSLLPNYQVLRVELLGHGKTGHLGYIHSMKDMAEAVEAVLEHLQIETYFVIGHSMGGYVALELSRINTKELKGLCLMNSTYKPDSKERKLLRKRANRMARENYPALVRMSYANLFSEESREQFPQEIEKGLLVALNTSVQGYLAAQEGMIQRSNFSEEFKTMTCKKMIILGKKDGLIDHEKLVEELLETNVEIVLLSEGHMSHVENKKDFTYNIMRFIEKL